MSVLMPRSQSKHRIGTVCRSSRRELRKDFTRRHICTFPHWARQQPLPQCGFRSVQHFSAKCAGLPYKNNCHMRLSRPFLDHADCDFSCLSERLRMLYGFGMESFTWCLWPVNFLTSETTLWTTVDGSTSMATSTIFYWTLFMLLYSFLVYDTHLIPCSPIQFSPSARAT